ncbi:MAG: hypothetical protein OXN97_01655 [Bryobacterales bacterium]|nr:hypothetical protein [Bryobacterales bacterium]
MDVKEAARIATATVASLFKDQQISNIMLEEVDFEELPDTWSITVGFFRQAEMDSQSIAGSISKLIGRQRSFKVVRIRDSDGKILSVKHRSVIGVD